MLWCTVRYVCVLYHRARFTRLEHRFDNRKPYQHYKVIFPRIKDPDLANAMQIEQVELLQCEWAAPGQECGHKYGDVEYLPCPNEAFLLENCYWYWHCDKGMDVIVCDGHDEVDVKAACSSASSSPTADGA